MSDKDIWHRPEFQDRPDEIESRREYEERNKLTTNLLSTRFRDYADRVPSIVMERWRSGTYPEKVYVTAELDEFLESISGRNKQRTTLEVRRSDVARYKRGVEAAEKRLGERTKEVERAQRYLESQQRRLKAAEHALKMEEALSD
jgi:hypothetical protein